MACPEKRDSPSKGDGAKYQVSVQQRRLAIPAFVTLDPHRLTHTKPLSMPTQVPEDRSQLFAGTRRKQHTSEQDETDSINWGNDEDLVVTQPIARRPEQRTIEDGLGRFLDSIAIYPRIDAGQEAMLFTHIGRYTLQTIMKDETFLQTFSADARENFIDLSTHCVSVEELIRRSKSLVTPDEKPVITQQQITTLSDYQRHLTPIELVQKDAAFKNSIGDDEKTVKAFDNAFRDSTSIQDLIACCNYRAIVHIAKESLKSVPREEKVEKILMGYDGLRRAIEKFDVSKGFKFYTYAKWWIKQSIDRNTNAELRNIRIPEGVADALVSAHAIAGDYIAKSGHPPTKEELTIEVKKKYKEYKEAVDLYFSGREHTLSLDMPVHEGTDNASTLGEFIADKRDETIDVADTATSQVDSERVKQVLHNALLTLSDKERPIVELLLQNGDLSYAEIGKRCGITRNTARSRKSSALAKLKGNRELFSAYHVDESLPQQDNPDAKEKEDDLETSIERVVDQILSLKNQGIISSDPELLTCRMESAILKLSGKTHQEISQMSGVSKHVVIHNIALLKKAGIDVSTMYNPRSGIQTHEQDSFPMLPEHVRQKLSSEGLALFSDRTEENVELHLNERIANVLQQLDEKLAKRDPQTQELYKQIATSFFHRSSYEKIAEETGLEKNIVRSRIEYMRKIGINLPKRPKTRERPQDPAVDAKRQKAYHLRTAHEWTFKQIARELGVSPNRIFDYVNEVKAQQTSSITEAAKMYKVWEILPGGAIDIATEVGPDIEDIFTKEEQKNRTAKEAGVSYITDDIQETTPLYSYNEMWKRDIV